MLREGDLENLIVALENLTISIDDLQKIIPQLPKKLESEIKGKYNSRNRPSIM